MVECWWFPTLAPKQYTNEILNFQKTALRSVWFSVIWEHSFYSITVHEMAPKRSKEASESPWRPMGDMPRVDRSLPRFRPQGTKNKLHPQRIKVIQLIYNLYISNTILYISIHITCSSYPSISWEFKGLTNQNSLHRRNKDSSATCFDAYNKRWMLNFPMWNNVYHPAVPSHYTMFWRFLTTKRLTTYPNISYMW